MESNKFGALLIPVAEPLQCTLARYSFVNQSFWLEPENLPSVMEGVSPQNWLSLCNNELAVHRQLPMHISTSVVVFRRSAEKNQQDNATPQWEALLLWHRKANEWVYPGGHADGNWNFLGSALRELTEETGLAGARLWSFSQAHPSVPAFLQALDVGKFRQNEEPHTHADVVYYVECFGSQEVYIEAKESLRYKWWPLERSMETLPTPTALAMNLLRRSLYISCGNSPKE